MLSEDPAAWRAGDSEQQTQQAEPVAQPWTRKEGGFRGRQGDSYADRDGEQGRVSSVHLFLARIDQNPWRISYFEFLGGVGRGSNITLWRGGDGFSY